MTFITMSNQELNRYEIIKRLIRGEINGTKASELLSLSARQVRRLKKRVSDGGSAGLLHLSRGKPSHNRIEEKRRQRIIDLLHHHYPDFGPTLATEKLAEKHHLKYDPKTIRSIMITQGLWKPKVKKAKSSHRQWRQRKANYGEMVQFDGSYEHWFEDRGGSGEVCLLAAIDDASGKIVAAQFADHEGVFPVFTFWQGYFSKHGLPHSIYLDKFSTYHQNQKVTLEDANTLTQFQRAMEELQVEAISANSPQAKGRVERLFGTLQDRLIKELRLANISSIPTANCFLEQIFIPQFNNKFAVVTKSKANLHRKLERKQRYQLAGILSYQSQRTVQNDFTLSFKNQWYQLDSKQPLTVYKKDRVIIEEWTDQSLRIRLRGKYLNYQLLPERPQKANQTNWVLTTSKPQQPPKPAPNHPWKRPYLYAQRIKN